jgi:hypothetical protein
MGSLYEALARLASYAEGCFSDRPHAVFHYGGHTVSLRVPRSQREV